MNERHPHVAALHKATRSHRAMMHAAHEASAQIEADRRAAQAARIAEAAVATSPEAPSGERPATPAQD